MGNQGGIVDGKLHSECDDQGCGVKFNIDNDPNQQAELERDEAVLFPEAFESKCFSDSFCEKPSNYKMTGTISQIASAINALGGNKAFDPGAKVWKNGRKMNKPRLTWRNSKMMGKNLPSGSVVINRTNMLNPKVMTFEGTAWDIASQINSYGGNGVTLEGTSSDNLKTGGRIENTRVKRPWEVRFHLGRGENYMKWRIENKDDKEVNFYDPEAVQITMYNCKLTNQVKTAERIFSGEINKRPIAWIKCVNAEISTEINPVDLEDRISYNPRKSPNWLNEKGEILDNHVFDKLITYGRSVFYDDGEQLFKIGGLVETDFFEEGGKVEKRYVYQADGYIYATSDEEAKEKVKVLRDKMDEASDWPTINHLHQNDSGSRYSRQVFDDGGSVLKLTKADKRERQKLKDRIKEETKRLRKFRKERQKTPSDIIGVATSVFQHHDEKGEQIQNNQLLSWIRDKENDVKVIVAFSGGKDSIAMVLHLFDMGVLPSQIELWHHLVDGKGEDLWDWPCTESYCQAFADEFGLKILFSYREGGITREIYRDCELTQDILYQEELGGEFKRAKSVYQKKYISTRKMFPAVSGSLETRWCSSTVKISVMSRAINNIARFKNANIVVCTGERREESEVRAKYVAMEPYRSNTRSRTAIQWRPVVSMEQDQVWEIIKRYKVQPHPAYELGWGRCSCQICIFSSPSAWASNNEISPDKIDRIEEIENDIGHTLRHENVKGKINPIPIKQYMKDGKSFLDPVLLEKWKDQILGEFTAPIIVEDWQKPAGASSLENCGAN